MVQDQLAAVRAGRRVGSLRPGEDAFYPVGEQLRFIQHTSYRVLDFHSIPGFSEVTVYGVE